MYTEFHLRVKSVNNRIRKTNSKSQRYREKKGNGRGVLSADFFYFFPIRHGETYYKMWGPRQSTPLAGDFGGREGQAPSGGLSFLCCNMSSVQS